MIILAPRAVDMASLLCRDFWHADRTRTGEGIHAWLRRMAQKALEDGDTSKSVGGKIDYAGITFRFEYDAQGITLVGVRPSKRRGVDANENKEALSRHGAIPETK